MIRLYLDLPGFRALLKARPGPAFGQLGLFGAPATPLIPTPTPTPPVPVADPGPIPVPRPVAAQDLARSAYVRLGATGPQLVVQGHQHYHVAPEAEPAAVQPPAELPAEEQPAPAAPMPEVDPRAAIPDSTPLAPVAPPKERPPIDEGDLRAEPGAYWYGTGLSDTVKAPPYLPPGALEPQQVTIRNGFTNDVQITVFRTDEPLEARDRFALGLVAMEPGEDGGWRVRPSSPSELGERNEKPASLGLRVVLDDKLDAMNAGIAALGKKAQRFGLEAPSVEILGAARKFVAVEVLRDAEGREIGLRSAWLPATLVRVQGPTVQIPGGWRLRAKITPIEGPGGTVNQIGEVGAQPGSPLPSALWKTGMHCDHCGTDRDRSKLYAFQNPEGKWKRVGSACLKDFSGVSPDALAFAAGYLTLLDEGGGDEWDQLPHGAKFPKVQDVLAAVSAIVEEQGGFISMETSKRLGEESTATQVYGVLGFSRRSTAAQERLRAEMRKPQHQLAGEEILNWMRSIDPEAPETSTYQKNLRAYAEAGVVSEKGVGTVASAFATHGYAIARAAAAERPTPTSYYGAPGGKIAAKPKKGETAAPPVTVKITFAKDTISQFNGGPGKMYEFEDDAGHRFKWWASGDPSAKPVEIDGHEVGGRLAIGSIVTIDGALITKHGEFRGIPETAIKNVRLSAVMNPAEVAAWRETYHENVDYNTALYDTVTGYAKRVRARVSAYTSEHPEPKSTDPTDTYGYRHKDTPEYREWAAGALDAEQAEAAAVSGEERRTLLDYVRNNSRYTGTDDEVLAYWTGDAAMRNPNDLMPKVEEIRKDLAEAATIRIERRRKLRLARPINET